MTEPESKIVGRNIRRLRVESDMTLEALADLIDTDSGNLSRVERGMQGLTLEGMSKIARALKVSTGQLLVDDRVLREPHTEYTARRNDPLSQFPRIPVVGTAQLGDDGYFEELAYPVGHGDGHVRYPTTDPGAYALRTKGDSMRPRIKPGEYVIVEPATANAPGDEVIVRTKAGRTMVKVLHSRRGGMVELYSVNEAHKALTLDESEIEFMHHFAGVAKPHLYFHE